MSKKIGDNPPVAELRPEEIPLIATMFNDEKVDETLVEIPKNTQFDVDVDDKIDDEIQPQNYFF